MNEDRDPKRPKLGRVLLSIATLAGFSAIVITGVFPIGLVVLVQLSGEGSEAWRPRAWIVLAGVLAMGVAHFSHRRVVKAVLTFAGVGSLLQYVLFAGLSDGSSIEVATSLPFFCLAILDLWFAARDLKRRAE